MFASPTNTYNVTTSFGMPTSSYLPNPSPSLSSQTINQQNAQMFGQGDLRSLLQQYLPSSNSGVSNDYQTEAGAMSLMNGPRSQAASNVMQDNAGVPYTQNRNNFNALLGLQNANAQQAFGLGGQAQGLGQAYQGYQLGNFGGQLGLVQNLLSQLLGGIGNMTSGATGGGSSSGLGSLVGGGGSGQVGIPGLQTG